MNTLALIGIFLFFAGLLIFSIKLIAYNRRKYSTTDESIPSYQSVGGMNMYRILAIVLLLTSLVIIYLFGD